jgi:hypothetical protein
VGGCYLSSCVPCGWSTAPPFISRGGEQFTCMPHCFYVCSDMADSAAELTTVLANPAPVEASWCVLCSYRSGFEGVGAVVG